MDKYPLVCLENPLLDIQVDGDQALLDKYSLKANDAILAEAAHLPIYEEITTAKYAPKYLAGGAAQNSARGAQYMLPAESVIYIGCIGRDAFGEQLTNACVREGVLTKYRVEEEQPTGRCAVVITGHDRSMVTDLGAANHYKLEHLKSPEIWSYVEKARIYYVGGYHLTVCVPAVLALGEHAAENNKVFAMNLSAPFLATFFKEQMDSVSPYWDYIIGNESEALAYAEAHDFKTKDISEIAARIAALPKKNSSRPRTVVITQGTDPTIVATGGDEPGILTFPVRAVEEDEIVDTNGAGDAFAGGFLAGLVQGKDLAIAVDMGHWLASWGIREPGPAYPAKKQHYSREL